MRSSPALASVSLLLIGCSACGARRGTATGPAPSASIVVEPSSVVAPEAGSPPAPAPIEFTDLGDDATIEVGDVRVHLVPAGPGLIAIDVAAVRRNAELELERHVLGKDDTTQTQTAALESGRKVDSANLEHTAVPGTTYGYRARVDKGKWSDEVKVRTARPSAPPPKPAALKVEAIDPYSVRVSWQGDTRPTTGFVLEVRSPTDWKVAAVLKVTAHEFTHNTRLPKSEYNYRIAAFNEHGKSELLEAAPVKTPEKAEKPPKKRPLSPCVKTVPAPPESSGFFPSELNESPRLVGVHDVATPNSWNRHLFGEYKGCLRELGVFTVQDMGFSTREGGIIDEGFPLLQAVAGAGEFLGANIDTYRFAAGHYEEVNVSLHCGESKLGSSFYDAKDPTMPDDGDKDVTKWTGPFEECQRE